MHGVTTMPHLSMKSKRKHVSITEYLLLTWASRHWQQGSTSRIVSITLGGSRVHVGSTSNSTKSAPSETGVRRNHGAIYICHRSTNVFRSASVTNVRIVCTKHRISS